MDIDQFIKCLMGIKVSSGYCGKISRFIDPKKKRFSGIKSHDYHVMMTQILLVSIRGIMEKHVRDTLTGLCKFFELSPKPPYVLTISEGYRKGSLSYYVSLRCTSRPHSLTSWCICIVDGIIDHGRHSVTA